MVIFEISKKNLKKNKRKKNSSETKIDYSRVFQGAFVFFEEKCSEIFKSK